MRFWSGRHYGGSQSSERVIDDTERCTTRDNLATVGSSPWLRGPGLPWRGTGPLRAVTQRFSLTAFVLAFSVAGCADQPDVTASPTAEGSTVMARVGITAPDVSLPLATGGTLSLSSLRGKPVIVEFLA